MPAATVGQSVAKGFDTMDSYLHFAAVAPTCMFVCRLLQQEKYLQGRSERMTRILQEAAAVAAAMAAASQQPGGAAAAGSSTAAVPAGVENAEAWGFAPNGIPPGLPRFVKALDERLINTMQETVMNVNGIFLQVCATRG
jgi:hypothetical protein